LVQAISEHGANPWWTRRCNRRGFSRRHLAGHCWNKFQREGSEELMTRKPEDLLEPT
jgi:hypothetical protein